MPDGEAARGDSTVGRSTLAVRVGFARKTATRYAWAVVNDLNSGSFGLLISYVLPGMTALWALSYPSPTVRAWLTDTAAAGPTIGGFLNVTLAALVAGLVASTVRWMTIDRLHALTGLRRPTFNYGSLCERISGFDLLVRHHYEYYKFHANMLVAVLFWAVARHIGPGGISPMIDGVDVLALILVGILFVGSRDNLRNYYERTRMLLGSVADPPVPDPAVGV
jgi:hypothetical protein